LKTPGSVTSFALTSLSGLMRTDRSASDVTEDTVLGGRLRLRQPRRGHRVGHDAILLAAAVPARAGEIVVELGAGVGAAGLALAARVPGIRLTMVELVPGLATLAAENAELNGVSAEVVELDVAAPARVFAATGLRPEQAARILMNPPFNDPARQRVSPDRGRQLAHAAPRATLAAWTRTAARLLRPRGTLSLIWRADGLGEVLEALAPAFGATMVLPVYPKPAEGAIRVLVRATKASQAPLQLLPGLVLNDSTGCATREADRVLRTGEALPLAEHMVARI
jgi:tRNA1(Val) A37 N6-methylase TrmN6